MEYSNNDILAAKLLLMEQKYNKMRQVAVAADIFYDSHAHSMQDDQDLHNLKAALDKVEL